MTVLYQPQAELANRQQARSGKLISSSRRDHCPCCDRHHDGSCRIGTDMVLCWRGSTFAPPTWAQKPGDHGPGADGQIWAFLGDADGWAQFRLHKHLGRKQRRQAQRRQKPAVARLELTLEDNLYWSSDPPSYRPTHPIVAALYALYLARKGQAVQA